MTNLFESEETLQDPEVDAEVLLAWIELPEKKKKRVSEQRKFFREQFQLIIDDMRFQTLLDDKSYKDADGQYKFGVSLYPDFPPVRIDDFNLSRLTAQLHRLKRTYEHLTTGRFRESYDLGITEPFKKCIVPDCNFTYIRWQTLDEHITARHPELME